MKTVLSYCCDDNLEYILRQPGRDSGGTALRRHRQGQGSLGRLWTQSNAVLSESSIYAMLLGHFLFGITIPWYSLPMSFFFIE